MKNIYFVQTGIDFGDAIYLPYGAGAIIANCMTYPEITKEYAFQDIIYERKSISCVINEMHSPYIVFFSCNIWNIEYNKCLANAVKKMFPDCYIAFGGHSVGNSTELMEQEKNIDFLNFGEGEPTVPDLLIHLLSDDVEKVKSIAFRQNGKVIKTAMRPVCDLSDYPSPYTMGLFDKIIKEHPNTDFSSILETNRGCPYHCAFCDWSDNRKIRFFPMERIQAEILWMAKNKIERIDQEIEKTREKIAEYQEKLKTLEAQKTEAENLEIVQMVRALRMTPAQLNAMLSGGMNHGRDTALPESNNQGVTAYEE